MFNHIVDLIKSLYDGTCHVAKINRENLIVLNCLLTSTLRLCSICRLIHFGDIRRIMIYPIARR